MASRSLIFSRIDWSWYLLTLYGIVEKQLRKKEKTDRLVLILSG